MVEVVTNFETMVLVTVDSREEYDNAAVETTRAAMTMAMARRV
jgi:hypothetical protein